MKWDISSPRFYKASANATVRQISFLSTDPPLPQYKDYNAVAIDNLRTEEEECKQLLRIAEASTVEDTSGTPRWDRAMINTGGAGQILATDQRKCESVIVDTPELADKLLARLMPFMKKEGVDHIHNQPLVPGLGGRGKACRLSRLNEKLRFLGYVGGEYFRPDWDSNYITPDEEEEESFYTLHLYLNGDGEQGPQELMQVSKKAEIGPEANVNMNPEGKLLGGTTSFSTSHKEGCGIVQGFPKTGSALVFHQYHLLHDGDPVFRGVKYTLRTDIMYREVVMT